jgi:N-acyl-D-aspartate/D-glutamate deacylase
VVRNHGRVWQATPPKDDKLAVFRNFLLTSGLLHGRTLKVTAVAAIDVATNRSLLRLALLMSKLLNSRFVRGHFRLQALAAPFKVWSDGMITPIAEEVPVLRRLNECDLEDREGRRRIMDKPGWRDDFRAMWYRGKRGFGIARLKRWLNLDDNVLTRDLADMVVETCPVADWSGEPLQAVYERVKRWQATGQGARSAGESDAFAAFPKPVADDCEFFLHLLRAYDTELRWWTVTANRDARVIRDLLFNPLLLPGFNDSGAHLTNMAFYDGNLRTLKIAQVEGLGRISEAVRRLSAEPAEFFGLDVGTLRVGARADLVVVDPDALSRWQPEATVKSVWREAFSSQQLVNRPEGVVTQVVVGGVLAWDGAGYTRAFGAERLGEALLHRDHRAPVAALAA